jgi:predicted glycosyltransferase
LVIDPDEPYVLIRLSGLTAHHDAGIRGISDQFLRQVIHQIGNRARIVVSSERSLTGELERRRLSLPVSRIHHVLAFARAVLADSQTMIAEAAVLGTPAIRINDFVGRIGYLDALEQFGLSYGYTPDQGQQALDKLDSLLADPRSRERALSARSAMLAATIDPVPFVADALKKQLLDS